MYLKVGNFIFSYLICDLSFSEQSFNLVAIALSVSNLLYPWQNIFKKAHFYFILYRIKRKEKEKIQDEEVCELKKSYEEEKAVLVLVNKNIFHKKIIIFLGLRKNKPNNTR